MPLQSPLPFQFRPPLEVTALNPSNLIKRFRCTSPITVSDPDVIPLICLLHMPVSVQSVIDNRIHKYISLHFVISCSTFTKNSGFHNPSVSQNRLCSFYKFKYLYNYSKKLRNFFHSIYPFKSPQPYADCIISLTASTQFIFVE